MSLEQNYTAMWGGVCLVSRGNKIKGLKLWLTCFTVQKHIHRYGNWYGASFHLASITN